MLLTKAMKEISDLNPGDYCLVKQSKKIGKDFYKLLYAYESYDSYQKTIEIRNSQHLQEILTNPSITKVYYSIDSNIFGQILALCLLGIEHLKMEMDDETKKALYIFKEAQSFLKDIKELEKKNEMSEV